MISFIVPGLPDEKHLYKCLDSIYTEIDRVKDGSEIILVMKCEKERQEKLREELNQRYGRRLQMYGSSLSCYFDDGNRSEARNLGVTYAKSNYLTFVDADTKIGENFISMTEEAFEKGYAYVNNSIRPLEEEWANKTRLLHYSRFMGLNQWFLTKARICRPYGFCMSVKKDICERTKTDGEIFMRKLAGHGEDSEFGSRYGLQCRKEGLKGKYESYRSFDKKTAEKMRVKTSFRGWYEEGFWRGGVRMLVNVFLVPLLKRPLIGNWREIKQNDSTPYGNKF
jgi:glycosyltransferase involved in cell wall biosynthesis